MVTYCVTKIISTCSPVIGQFFDTMIVASFDKECNYDPSKSTSWKVLETVLSHLKHFRISSQPCKVSLFITVTRSIIASYIHETTKDFFFLFLSSSVFREWRLGLLLIISSLYFFFCNFPSAKKMLFMKLLFGNLYLEKYI